MRRALILVLAALSCASAAQLPPTVDLRLAGKPLLVLAERIAKQCEAGLAVQRSARRLLDAVVTIDAQDVPWGEARTLLRSQYRVELELQDGRLVVTDAAAAGRQRLELRFHDVRGLAATLDRPAPRLGFPEASGITMLAAPAALTGDANLQACDLTELVRQVDPETWKLYDGAQVEDRGGVLRIVQVPEVQERIAAMLQGLRRQMAREVVCRCYRLQQPPEAAAPVVDAATWRRLGEGLQPAMCLVVADGNRNHHCSGRQRSVIYDADVNQSQYMPMMATLMSGLAVEVVPHVVSDGVLVEVWLQSVADPQVVPEPLTDTAGRRFFELDMASMAIDGSRDTRLIPPGGAAIFRFGSRSFALTCTVEDAAQR